MVILGAGYAGIFAAANLCRTKVFDIILIDKNPYRLLLQQIPQVVSGEKFQTMSPFALQNCSVMNSWRVVENFHGLIKGVDLTTKTLRLEGVRAEAAAEIVETLKYDYLLISLGAETHYFGVPGAEKHCLTFRSLQDVIEIRQKVESLPANSIVVVGEAGASGVSLAALTQLFIVPAKISPRSALVRLDDRTAIILFPTRTGCFLQIPQKHQEMLHPSFSITDQPSFVWIARCLIFDCGAK